MRKPLFQLISPAVFLSSLLLAGQCIAVSADSPPFQMPITTASEQHRATLSEISQPFSGTDDELIDLLASMNQAMTLANGDGIAAIQIGMPLRVFLFRRYDQAPEEPIQVAINPQIIKRSDTRISSWDGCLSVPAGVGRVLRHQSIDVRYRDDRGQWIQETLTGLTGVIFQHEMDHLNGRLFTSHIPTARLLPLSEYFELYDEIQDQCEEQHLSDIECRAVADSHWRRVNP